MISKILKACGMPPRPFSMLRIKKDHRISSLFLENSDIVKKIKENLKNTNKILILYIDLVKFHEITQVNGSDIATEVLNIFCKFLDKEFTKLLPSHVRVLDIKNIWGDDFVILATFTGNLEYTEQQKIAVALRLNLKEKLKQAYIKITSWEPDAHVGLAVINDFRAENVETLLYNALREAQAMARGSITTETAMLLAEFKEILEQRKLEIVYQPIISLRSGGILGWEALTRGPLNSYFRNPDIIFSFAEEARMLYALERTCRRLAIEKIGELGPDQKLFLNIHPRTICDPNFTKGETIQFIKMAGLKPSNVVFEITERHHIKDFPHFNRTLDYYRNQGYMVAVDDMGSGFSSLQSIAEIRPDFIKVDMSLVRDINHHHIKRVLLETIISYAEKIGCSIIAEGIETEEELSALIRIGTHYGQGYFLGRPVFPKSFMEDALRTKVLHMVTSGRNPSLRYAFPVGEIASEALTIHPCLPIREAKSLLENNDELDGLVVVDNGKPAGLLMRYRLDRFLGMQYGVPLYFDRPVAHLMDTNPLIFEEDTPIEVVSQAAMNREKLKLYDYIVIIKNQLFKGIVSVQTLLDTMTKIRLEMAKGSNPLTGLPGNVAIEQELARRVRQSKELALIYLDLDNFKAYNDKYGFNAGDKLILFTASLIQSTVKKFGNPEDFIGHIGGDDFVLITSPEKSDLLCSKIALYFDRLVPRLYDHADRTAGGIYVTNRDGKETWLPFVSVSMAIVTEHKKSDPSYHLDYKELSQKAAQLKRYAKSLPGSVYVRDRRSIE